MLGVPSEIWVPIQLTLELAAVTTLSLLIVATPLAWWLARSRAGWKEAVAAVVSLPMVLPPTVLGFYLLILLGPDGPGGVIASFWGARTLAFTFTGLVIGSIISSMPFVVQPIRNAFAAIGDRNPELLSEHSQLLHRRRPMNVRRDHQGMTFAIGFQKTRELRQRGRLARALQADEHNLDWRFDLEVELACLPAHHFAQLGGDKFDQMLLG